MYNLPMLRFLILFSILGAYQAFGATIAIIDTGFDLDHEFLRPRIFKSETDEEAIDPRLSKKFHGWNFHDNDHLKRPVIEDQTALQEVLLFRSLRAKGHREGLTPEEFEWFSKRNSDKAFMTKVRQFKKHAHGTFVAGIALREGENINIFPIRGLNIKVPVVAVEDNLPPDSDTPPKAKTAQEKFNEEINNSLNRISRKFSKICHYLSLRKIEVVNASYGITYKNIVTKFRETYQKYTGMEIDEQRLQSFVNMFFTELYSRGEKTMRKYPHMLFVFSAGNSGLNNDQFHHYPSRIKLANTLSVAAMNGEFLASFSNYGVGSVDIGAPGVAILSLVPKVYAKDGKEMYSPSSGTSMAAPYISNLAAQIMNTNKRLSPTEVKQIIVDTGDIKDHLKNKLTSASLANNNRALKAALLSREMPLGEAISLARLDLIPMEDKISIGMAPAVSAENMQEKVMQSIPQAVSKNDVDEEPTIEEKNVEIKGSTRSGSSSRKDPEKGQQGKSDTPPSPPQDAQEKSADPVPASQNAKQSPLPSEETPASSSQPESLLPKDPLPGASPVLPQL